MDQNRLFIAIAMSLAILIGFEFLAPKPKPVTPIHIAPVTSTLPVDQSTVIDTPRLPIAAPRVQGSIALAGAKLDDLVLKNYRETINPKSPLVRVLSQDGGATANYVQFGWLSDQPGVAVPNNKTLWHADGAQLTPATPVTLSWDNGQGLTFAIKIAIDRNYMFSVIQSVTNHGKTAVSLHPWSRVRRAFTPVQNANSGADDGMLDVENNRLHNLTYKNAKTAAAKAGGLAYSVNGAGGWAGITDKYWLTAIVPDAKIAGTIRYLHVTDNGADKGWQVDFTTDQAEKIAPGATATYASRAFAGAKEVPLLDRYEAQDGIESFDKAVDFGWLYFVSKPIFYALDWLNNKVGNFGVAIMIFTVAVKLVFFPLANKSYASGAKMGLVSPKLQAIRAQFKDDPAKMQEATMAAYKEAGVNPMSGCLPMLVTLPVFFALNSVLRVSIEMRHAPFFGWIHDLSVADPTNLFNLFGLIPFNISLYVAALHIGAWPVIMGVTQYMTQRLSPQLPDPAQAKMMQLMPVVMTFILARYSAGLVIYWTWNNLLSFAQQYYIRKTVKIAKP